MNVVLVYTQQTSLHSSLQILPRIVIFLFYLRVFETHLYVSVPSFIGVSLNRLQEQKLALQSRTKDSHLNQLGEVEKRFSSLSRQCAMVKKAHEQLQQNGTTTSLQMETVAR